MAQALGSAVFAGRHRPALRPLKAESDPIVAVNTTPLIDVLLVLLVMLIITIPPQTHAIKLDLPSPAPPLPILPTSNEVTVEANGSFAWNGSVVNDRQLRALLDASQQARPLPELHLRPNPSARYEDVDRLMGLVKRERVSKVGFVGNEAYARW